MLLLTLLETSVVFTLVFFSRVSELRRRISIQAIRRGETGGSLASAQWVDLRLEPGGLWRRFNLAWDYVADHDRLRPWLVCGKCQTKRRHLYASDETSAASPWLCRDCLRLTYGIRTMYRLQPIAWRISRLRAQIGGDPHPFGELPPLPRRRDSRVRFVEIVREIGELEDLMLAGLKRTNRALQKLAERRGFLPKTERSTSTKRSA